MINKIKFLNGFHFKIALFISGTLLFIFIGKTLIAQEAESKSTSEKSYKLSLVRISPVYPGCTEIEGEFYIRKCLAESLDQHFKLNFDSSTLNENDLPHALVALTINQDGHISVNYVAPPNDRLDAEAARVVDKLPRVDPGLRKGVPVNVSYHVGLQLVDANLEIKSESGAY